MNYKLNNLRTYMSLLINGVAKEKVALAAFLFFIFLVYLWNINVNGYANYFYSAAIQAASTNWKSFFFASFDGGDFLAIDKPPLAIWIAAIFVRIFGLSSFSVLLPSVIAGLVTVYLVYKIVRIYFSSRAAFIAALIMAFMPISVTMFRLNNPDSLFVMLITLSFYVFLMFFEKYQSRWLYITAFVVGLAFNVKMLQAWIIIPVYIFGYIYFSKHTYVRKFINLFVASLILFASSFVWIFALCLTPVDQRPYIANTNNSDILELVFGYNGLNRISGDVDENRFGVFISGGDLNIFKLLDVAFLVNFGWMLPVVFLSPPYLYRSYKNTGRRVFIILVLGWAFVYSFIFSLMRGIIHPYYTIILAPTIAIISGIWVDLLWSKCSINNRRLGWFPVFLMALTGICEIYILSKVMYLGPIPLLILVLLLSAFVFVLVYAIKRGLNNIRAASLFFLLIFVFGLMAYYSFLGLSVPHIGLVPTSDVNISKSQSDHNEVDIELINYLKQNKGSAAWAAAYVSTDGASVAQVFTQEPIMAIGGFVGDDSIIKFEQFINYVKSGKIKYFVLHNRSMNHYTDEVSRITEWVVRNGKRVSIGIRYGNVVYDLSGL